MDCGFGVKIVVYISPSTRELALNSEISHACCYTQKNILPSEKKFFPYAVDGEDGVAVNLPGLPRTSLTEFSSG